MPNSTKRRLPFYRRAIYRVILSAQRARIYRRLAERLRPRCVISEATEDDLRAVGLWLSAHDASPLAPVHPGVRNYAAKSATRVVGFAQLVHNERAHAAFAGYWLFALQVRLLWRGSGVGTALCQEVIRQATAEGAPSLSLLVSAANAPAIALYRKLGFEVASTPALDAALETDTTPPDRRRIAMSRPL